MRCPKCRSDNPGTHRFCGNCGAPLAMSCGNCGFENAPDSRFCGQCGSPLADAPPSAPVEEPVQEAERRHMTVMFCDLADSTILSRQLDPEDLRHLNLAYQKRCAAIVQRYDGFVARFMGDGVLAYFGYPHAHEDDVERAIRAGLALVDGISELDPPLAGELPQPLSLRVGIATGTVVVGDLVGEGAAQEAAVVGETPNLAARLQVAAQPNSVYVSDATRRLAEGRFEFADLGPQALKGFGTDQRVWRVLREVDSVSRFEATHRLGLTPMVGRDREMALLSDRLSVAMAGEGQVVLICGEPGIGKSRLVEAVSRPDQAQGHLMQRLQCSPLHMNSAFYPVAGWLHHAAGIDRGDADDVKLDKLARLVDAHETGRDEAVALLAQLLAVPLDDRYAPVELGERELKRRTLALLSDLLLSHRGRGALVVVEDIHWIDPTSLELIDHLVDQAPGHACLILATYRPEFEASWVGQAHVTLMTLNRMNPKNCAMLIANVMQGVIQGAALPQSILDRIAEKTDGIPLFVEELTKAVLESGLADEEMADHPLNQALSGMAIPDTLQDSLMARLDRLEPAKEILHIGAVIGREFSHELLAAVARQRAEDLNSALKKLLLSQLVYQRGTGADAVYIFKHALVRDTAYDSILTSKRRLLHARVARAIEEHFPDIVQADAGLLAQHHEEAGALGKAVGYWRQAAEQALTRLGMAEAVADFEQALALVTQLPDSVERARKEVDIRVELAKALRVLDRYDDAHACLVVAEDLAMRHGQKDQLASVHYCRGNVYFPQGKVEACMEQHQRALSYALETGLPDREARALSGLGDAHYLRCEMATAEEKFAKCVAICRNYDLPRIEAPNRMMLAWTGQYARDLQTAIARGREAVDFARGIHHKRAEMIAAGLLAAALFDHGEPEAALDQADAVIEISRNLGAGRFLAFSLYEKAIILLSLGERDTALTLVGEGLEVSHRSSHIFSGPCLLGAKAGLLPRGPDRDAALREADAILASGCPGHNHLVFNRDMIELCLEERDWTEAERYCGKLESFTAAQPLPWSDYVIQRGRLLARIGRGDGEEDVLSDLARLERTSDHLGQIRLKARIADMRASLTA